ncbi:hypothetical protein R1CP_23575 [Rhodococcus opacus]|uniref:Uncharacterized protein n=1 Tax=Rhodococcus opacus TaxID=37919 RepID=A0A1B1K9R3_RHOOP|nr:hypothetical protein [Rhodococcus opacus]ANS29383.1 hypothetical protein R1CP_23575 [Rhodococcus opacus]
MSDLLPSALSGENPAAAKTLAAIQRALSDGQWHSRDLVIHAARFDRRRASRILNEGTRAGLWKRVDIGTRRERWLYAALDSTTPEPKRPRKREGVGAPNHTREVQKAAPRRSQPRKHGSKRIPPRAARIRARRERTGIRYGTEKKRLQDPFENARKVGEWIRAELKKQENSNT